MPEKSESPSIEFLSNDINKFNQIIGKLKSKQHILQFTTKRLLDNLNQERGDKVFFEGKLLKKAYIIDLLNTFIMELFLKKKSVKVLNSVIMKDKYSNEYNHIVSYLSYYGFITKLCGYTQGKSSCKYRFINKDGKENYVRYKNTDKFLIKKYVSRVTKNYIDNKFIECPSGNNIDPIVVRKMIGDFAHISLDYDSAVKYAKDKYGEDNTYNYLMFSIDCIYNLDYRFGIDRYGRFHTNLTNLKSVIRDEYILLDGEKTRKLDITNSQPLFFLEVLLNGIGAIDDYEFKKFKRLVIEGTIYEYFMERYPNILRSRALAKEFMYVVMFGKNTMAKIQNRIFLLEFPTIFNFIKKYKKELGDYRRVSHMMQSAESELIFNKIIKDIIRTSPSVVLFTVHDSIHVKTSDYEYVKKVFDGFLNEYKDNIESTIYHLGANLSPKAS